MRERQRRWSISSAAQQPHRRPRRRYSAVHPGANSPGQRRSSSQFDPCPLRFPPEKTMEGVFSLSDVVTRTGPGYFAAKLPQSRALPPLTSSKTLTPPFSRFQEKGVSYLLPALREGGP